MKHLITSDKLPQKFLMYKILVNSHSKSFYSNIDINAGDKVTLFAEATNLSRNHLSVLLVTLLFQSPAKDKKFLMYHRKVSTTAEVKKEGVTEGYEIMVTFTTCLRMYT